MGHDFFDKLIDGLKGAYEVGKDLTEELTQKGKLKYAIYSIKKEIKTNQAELGNKIYQKYMDKDLNVFDDEEILAYITEIKQLNTLLQETETAYEEIRKKEDTAEEEPEAEVNLKEKYEDEIKNLKNEIDKMKREVKEDKEEE